MPECIARFLFLALNVVCCETALRLELRARRKCGACARNNVDDRCCRKSRLFQMDKFSRDAGAFLRKLSGTREQSQFQPAGLVSSLRGVRVPTAGFNVKRGEILSPPTFFVFRQHRPLADKPTAPALLLE